MPGGERVKLLDFGIAKLREPADDAGSGTHPSLIMGTPAYMSPEQCRGNVEIDDKTDVYSLGIMLYRLLAHRLPFKSDGPGELVAMQIYQAPTPITETLPWLPEVVAIWVHKLLVKDRGERPSAQETAEALELMCAEFPELRSPDVVSVREGPEYELLAIQEDSCSLRTETDGKSPANVQSLPRSVQSSPSRRSLGGPSGSQQPRTTGSISNGELDAVRGGRRFRLVRWVALAGVLLFGSVFGQFLFSRHKPDASKVAPPPGSAAAPRPLAPKPRVHWTIRTTPPGAEIIRISDGTRLGQTPFTYERAAAEGTEELRLIAPGYAEHLVAIDRSQDLALDAVLEALPKASPEDDAPATAGAKKPHAAEPKPQQPPPPPAKKPKPQPRWVPW
jgi:serine/threonine-protein kinase